MQQVHLCHALLDVCYARPAHTGRAYELASEVIGTFRSRQHPGRPHSTEHVQMDRLNLNSDMCGGPEVTTIGSTLSTGITSQSKLQRFACNLQKIGYGAISPLCACSGNAHA